MKSDSSFSSASLLKVLVFAAIFLAGYWFLEHWDDFKAGVRGDPPVSSQSGR